MHKTASYKYSKKQVKLINVLSFASSHLRQIFVSLKNHE